ncbi:MAG: YdjY domain-containing protein [Planctomycetaceae bacterium]|jgi:hypothetical protein|nr:YdjY domain-containing protein [Planctomycetaceae bacterium]
MKQTLTLLLFLFFPILSQNIALAQNQIVIHPDKKAKEPQKPLVDDVKLLDALDPNGEIWVAKDKKSVILLATVCLNKGVLEFFLCSTDTKDYESVVSTSVKPYMIHAALLVTGIEPGTPVIHSPKFKPPTGPVVKITVRWLDKDGKRHETDARKWVQNIKSKKSLESDWVFAGSLFRKQQNGRLSYLADSTGEIIGVSNFATVVLDVPFESSNNDDSRLFQAFTENIPESGTPVTLILTPEKTGKDKLVSTIPSSFQVFPETGY